MSEAQQNWDVQGGFVKFLKDHGVCVAEVVANRWMHARRLDAFLYLERECVCSERPVEGRRLVFHLIPNDKPGEVVGKVIWCISHAENEDIELLPPEIRPFAVAAKLNGEISYKRAAQALD